MATYTPKRLAGPVLLGTTTGTSLYSVNTGVTGIVKEIIVANTSSSAATVTVYIIPSGGTPTAANVIVPAVTLAGNSFLDIPVTYVMNANETIQAIASTASVVSLSVHGTEVA